MEKQPNQKGDLRMRKNTKRFIPLLSIIFLLLFIFILPACSQQAQTKQQASEAAGTEKSSAQAPVKIENFNRTLTFTEAPKRAVSLNQHTTEIMLALGLEDRMVGTAYLDDEILPEFKDQYNKIPVLAAKYPSLEVLLGTQPDFVYGRQSAFGKKGVASVEDLAQKGIQAYVAQGTYVETATIKDVYEDILNIGRIFRVEKKAEDLVAEMKKDIQKVQQQIGKVEKPARVLVYDSGDDALFTVGRGLTSDLISLAGGQNVFDDIPKSWVNVSWEESVKRAPDVIVIADYGNIPAAEKIKKLSQHPALADVPAIKNKRFVVLPLSDIFEGIRNARAVDTLAKGFYPDKFKQ
jgi:iron complex transport system substrate-binding protein